MQRTSAPITPPSAYKTVIRSASPRASIIRREDIEEAGSQVSKATTRYGTRQSHAGSVRSRDDESLASSPSVPNYMQATQSAKAKVRSHSTPKQRPGNYAVIRLLANKLISPDFDKLLASLTSH